jgi:pyruvyl transferase EpsO
MDKPNTLLDNSYGKNSNYYHTGPSGIGSAQLIVKNEGKTPNSNASQLS